MRGLPIFKIKVEKETERVYGEIKEKEKCSLAKKKYIGEKNESAV